MPKRPFTTRFRRHPPMLWLIFTPVLLFGLGLLCLAGLKVAQHLSSLSWQAVPGTLEARWVDLEKDPAFPGTEKIHATARQAGRYRYAWGDQSYSSDRLAFFSARTRGIGGSSEAVDDWDRRLAERLHATEGGLTVWVNPRAPEQAVLLRDIRWLELGLMVGFGLFLTWAGWTFLFSPAGPAAPPGFSWRVVAIMWVFGGYLAVLAPLLWRDGHPVWAVLTAIPLLLAMHGTVHGLTRHAG